jgi:PilZ domain
LRPLLRTLLKQHVGEAIVNNREKRQSARKAIAATVHIATGIGPPLKCTMMDVSKHGARIAVDDSESAPQEFLLLLKNDLLRWCRVMWRSDREIGIQFIQSPNSLKTKGGEGSTK